MNDRKALAKLLSFVRETRWETMDEAVRAQAKKCFLDLAGALTAGAKNHSAKCAAAYVAENYPEGPCTVFATGKKTNFIGASLANGMAANALDLDDGFSLVRGHPGAGFFGALLSAAEETDPSWGELLAALTVAFEVSIRQAFSIRNYYGYDHSSGSYGAFATAASAGKLFGLNDEQMESALSIADFIMPVTPAKRSTFVPSMNKDGIYFGQHAGAEAVKLALSGVTGRNMVILDDEYTPAIDTLGEKYYMFDLYVKFLSCCRWAHSPIRALKGLMEEYGFTENEVERIDVYTFGNAGTLYMEAPTSEDEAQYNIKYPIAAQLLFGDCGPLESSTDKMLDSRVPAAIEKIAFHRDASYDALFPAKRFSRVEVTLTDGRLLNSGPVEPLGDRNAEVSIEMIREKIHACNDIYAPEETTEKMIRAVLNTPAGEKASVVLDRIRELALTNDHPEIRHI